MNKRINNFFGTVKWFGIPLGLCFFFLLFIFSIPREEQTSFPNPSTSPQQQLPTPPLETEDQTSALNTRSDLQKKEALPGGATQYTFSSSNPARPNMFITINQSIVFERLVVSSESPLKITENTAEYGLPEVVIQGSRFYGDTALTYIYAGMGIAFIANPAANSVLERHGFSPMTVDEYIKFYGEDIIDPAKRVSPPSLEPAEPKD